MNVKSSNEHIVPIEDLVNPRALDYHAETGNIFFADTTSFLIGRQKVDGSGRETILKDGNYCNHFALFTFLILFTPVISLLELKSFNEHNCVCFYRS